MDQRSATLQLFRVPGFCFRRPAKKLGLSFVREEDKYGLVRVFTVIKVFILGAVLDHGFSDGSIHKLLDLVKFRAPARVLSERLGY